MSSTSSDRQGQSALAIARAALDGHFLLPGANAEAAAAWKTLRTVFSSAADAPPAPSTLASAGVQDMMAGVGNAGFPDCPPEWLDKPFARIRWLHLNADSHAEADHLGTWVLAEDQQGTVLVELIERHGLELGAAPTPADILADLAGSRWVQDALQSALARDPIDAANDAEVLARVLAHRARETLSPPAGVNPGDAETG